MGQAGSQLCANCGTMNSANDQFCSNCGYSLASGPPDLTIQASQVAPTIIANKRRITGALQAGNLLSGRYRVVQMLGKGGFGAVYRATDGRFQFRRTVAVKEMSDAQLSPKEKATAIQNFRNEAELLVELNHPNLPNVSDFFEEGGKAYLVMEFIEGKTLETVQEDANSPLDERLVMGWALQLCAVLHYLHTRPQPIIFRDMKPANVMVTADGQIKLIDFGIARIFKAAGTKDTTLLGSQGYAPLEQYGRGQSDARSDIYALGATLYDLLTHELPADSPSRRINPQIFVLPRQITPAISSTTEAIVLKAMAEEPPNRYQSAADMYQAIAATGIATTSGTLLPTGNTLTQMQTVSGRPYPNTPPTLISNTQSSNSQGVTTAPPINPPPGNQPPYQPPVPPPGSPNMSRRALLIGGAVVIGAVAVGGTALYFSKAKPGAPANGPTTTIHFTYSTEKIDWIQQAITDFNSSNTAVGGKIVQITGDPQGSVDAKNGILNGIIKPIAWSPASTLEINLLNYAWKNKNGKELTSSSNDLLAKELVLSPLVFAIWKQRADIFKKKYSTVSWNTIHDAVKQASWADIGGQDSWGPVKLGQTRPDQSNSGLLSITLIAYAYYKSSRGLTTSQIQDPGFLQFFQDIEGVVQAFGRSSGTYIKNEVIPKGPAAYDIIPTYENLVLTNAQAAQQRNGQILQPFYPSPNILSDHPFAIIDGDWVKPEDQQAAKAFRDFLLSDDQQRKALVSGFRPTSANVTLNDSVTGNPFVHQPTGITVQSDISNQAQAPSGDVVDALLKLWTQYYDSSPTALSETPNKHKGQQNNDILL